MKRTLTPRVLILAASIAGLIACDKAKQVQEEQQDLQQARQEVAQEQAELTQEQRQEQAEAQRDSIRDPGARRIDGTGSIDGVRPMDGTGIAGRGDEPADTAKEHAEERAELNEQHAEKLQDKREDVAEAKIEANEARGDMVKDSREKLRELDKRAAELRTKVSSADAENKAEVTSALSAFPNQRQALERDIDALANVKAANLSRAKDKVEQQLSSLDKTLDQAESKL